MKLAYLILISISVLAVACSSLAPGGPDITIPSKWNLESFGAPGAESTVVQDSPITLEFTDDKQLAGSGGCNSYGAQYELDGTMITIKEVVSTLMACADDLVMQQESEYFTALQSATSFDISGDKLTLFYADGKSQLNFSRQ